MSQTNVISNASSIEHAIRVLLPNAAKTDCSDRLAIGYRLHPCPACTDFVAASLITELRLAARTSF